MDMICQLKFLNISTITQGMKTNNSNLIKLTQLLISLSLFSFIISPSSLFVFLHYFKFYSSTLPFQLFTHNIDKNSMFLLANGLLVFVGLTKSFSASSSDDDKSSNGSDDLSSSKYIEEEDREEDHGSQSHILDVEANDPMLETEDEKITSELDEQNAAAEEEQENIENIIFIDEEQEEEINEIEDEEVELFDADDEEGAKESENDYIVIEENNIDDEEEEEEEESCISTEELNKKFEDFIRKMKEDLRIDARRHLIMV